MTEAVGSQSRIALDTALPFDANSFFAEFNDESIVREQPRINNAGIRGTRSHASERTRKGNRRAGGSVSFEVTRSLFDIILPAALGATEAANVFDVAETIPDLYFLIDKQHDVYLGTEAKIGKLTISGTQGDIVTCAIEVEAEDLIESGGTGLDGSTSGVSWPGTLVQPDTNKPFFFGDAAQVSINSSNREIFGFEIVIDNVLSSDQYGTNQYREELIRATDRIVTVKYTLSGDSSNNDLLDLNADGEANQLVLTNAEESGSVITIDHGRVAFDPAVPTISGKGPLRYDLQGQARSLHHAGHVSHVPDIRITNAHV